MGIGTSSPKAKLHTTLPNGNEPSYPTTTGRGDIMHYFTTSNNAMEFGLARGTNTRRAWILTRHASLTGFGQYYATLHLQPELDIMTGYRGVAIGYPASTAVPVNVALAVNGNVGIDIADPKAKLSVNGNILAKEIKIKTDITVPDYVFEPGYALTPLTEVETFVRQHKHLPEIPSAADIERDGLDLAEMNLLLLKKVEELTLHLIEKDRQLKQQFDLIENQRMEVREIKKEIQLLNQ